MITQEQKYELVSALKSHTLSSVRESVLPKLPIIIHGKEEYNINDEEEIKIEECVITNEKMFHYNDKWYSYKYSVDNPEYNFSILKVNNMPYNSFYNKRNKKSFVSTLQGLIYQGYCEPFVLFVNGAFVNWDCIDVVFDCDDSYLLIYDDNFNYYTLSQADINMIILPFKVEYVGIEPSSHFNIMYEATKSYIQDSLSTNDNGDVVITVPGINEVYEYNGMIYNIGSWLYTQLRYEYLGILSKERINKLKKIDVIKYEYDRSGNIIHTLVTKFNALDKDSYNKSFYNKICHLTKYYYYSRALFRFDNKGLLNDAGSNVISLSCDDDNKGIVDLGGITALECNDFKIYRMNMSIGEGVPSDYIDSYPIEYIDNILFKENVIIFDNGLYDSKCDYDTINNAIYLYSHDSSIENNYNMYIIYRKDTNRIINYFNHFNDKIRKLEIYNHFAGNIDKFKEASTPLDFKYTDKNLLSDNFNNGYNTIIKYDPTLLNDLYHTNITSTVFTGDDGNTRHYCNGKWGLKISRNKFKNNESYAMIFEDGELLREYSDMIVYPNFLFIPMNRYFNSSSQIEVLYFNNINNNEIDFEMTENMVEQMTEKDSKWLGTDLFNKVINTDELKIFSKYPENILIYKNIVNKSPNIAFNVSYKGSNNQVYIMKSVVEDAIKEGSTSNDFTAVSSRKFIYQRLYVDQKSYRILIDKRFRYCDNQKQYVLFVNGRRMNDESFLVTIPKYTRPFWGMYLYVAKFVGPEDRIELFYVPDELVDINANHDIVLTSHGYIETNKEMLKVPYDPRLYLMFINGKKISSTNIIPIDSHTVRISKDTFSLNNLMINPINTDYIDEVKSYFKELDTLSMYDKFMKYMKDTYSVKYFDTLFNSYAKMSNTELDKTKQNVGRIAIVNEIIRDFWATSGYGYNEAPFIYDYYTDDFIHVESNDTDLSNDNIVFIDDENLVAITDSGKTIKNMTLINYNKDPVHLIALDANQYANIIKNDFHLVYFSHPEEEIHEMGSSLTDTKFSWIISQNPYNPEPPKNQNIIIIPGGGGSSGGSSGGGGSFIIPIDPNSKEWTYTDTINSDITIRYEATTGNNQTISNTTTIRFANGIYYGNIDEDILQYYKSNYILFDSTMALQPKDGEIPTAGKQEAEDAAYTNKVYDEFNYVLNDLGFDVQSTVNNTPIIDNVNVIDMDDVNMAGITSDYRALTDIILVDSDSGVPLYLNSYDINKMLPHCNKSLQFTPELELKDYVIGNNNYFVYACPTRLVYDKTNMLIEFVMPNIKSDEVLENCKDDKTMPAYTNGKWSMETNNLLETLDEMKMICLGDFLFTNSSGYSEMYTVWRTNGYFTRAFENFGFNISVRYKNKKYNNTNSIN